MKRTLIIVSIMSILASYWLAAGEQHALSFLALALAALLFGLYVYFDEKEYAKEQYWR